MLQMSLSNPDCWRQANGPSLSLPTFMLSATSSNPGSAYYRGDCSLRTLMALS